MLHKIRGKSCLKCHESTCLRNRLKSSFFFNKVNQSSYILTENIKSAKIIKESNEKGEHMEEMKFRTMSPDEMDTILAKEESKKGKVAETFKTIGGAFCCIIALAAIALFVYVMFSLPAVETECTFAKWAFINRLCEFGMRCTQNDNGMMIIPICLVAVLVELLCARPINYVLQKLPLGRFPAISTDSLPKITALSGVLPALIVGLHITIYALSTELNWQAGIDFSKNVLIVTIILVGIVLLVLLANSVLQAGLWGFLLRGSLILTSNFGLAIVFGILGEALGAMLISVGLVLLVIIICYCILRFFTIASLF